MHRTAIAEGGGWFETRLLASGPRTNPWFQECSDRVIRDGDLVAFDTDHIGVGGYAVDISRTWLAGDGHPSGEQRTMYGAAYEQVQRNIEMLRPGMTFAEVSERAHRPAGDLHFPPGNAVVLHGLGVSNEYPLVVNRDLFGADGYDGIVEPGMVLCVEGLVAPAGRPEAVKLEEQVLITETGAEVLSAYPFSEALLHWSGPRRTTRFCGHGRHRHGVGFSPRRARGSSLWGRGRWAASAAARRRVPGDPADRLTRAREVEPTAERRARGRRMTRPIGFVGLGTMGGRRSGAPGGVG